MFFTKPSPAFGIMDFYVFNPINGLISKSYKVADLTLRDRLGGGNYGQVLCYPYAFARKLVSVLLSL